MFGSTPCITDGERYLFISCEMAHYELTSRIVSAVGRIPFDNIQSGKMEADDFERWVQTTAHELQKYKLDIVDKAGITINEIRGEIKKSIAKHGSIGCVIVDY
ncbi:DnaB helicase C-terminal domain-containing protein, partial [Escherichia coli]|uniref:DnaB helicase C-terminal domain-containing protein n=1 Tax=Escherichia coli TaxID=562 RepID=UPI001F30BC3B